MAYKFIQITDLGFNHSLSQDMEINKYAENLRKETFNKVIDLCIEERATALLICGNLYDEEHITYDNARLIKKGFAKLKSNDIAIVYAHGNLDNGYFLDSIENDIIEIKSRYTKNVYSFPFNIDKINFVGIGNSKRLVFQDEYLEEEKSEFPTIGLMYIDNKIYTGQTLELLYRRLQKSNVLYWALGGTGNFAEFKKENKYCGSGRICPKDDEASGCLVVSISNKLKVSLKKVDVCSAAIKNIYITDPYKSKDIYQLMERCVDLIEKSKIPGHTMIINLEISGLCTCYNQLVNHRKELQDEIAKVTGTKLYMNINNLTKFVKHGKSIGDKTQVMDLLYECDKLYDDDELYNKTISRVKTKRVFYSGDSKTVDKKKILEGVDSIIVESAVKEDSHDY